MHPILYRRLIGILNCIPINELLASDLISQLTDTQVQAIISGRLQQRAVEFTSIGSNTYTKPSDLVFAFVVCIGGGGGGGSGRKGITGSSRAGGGGGASGCMARRWISASSISPTETITVGSGGTGGTGITADSTSGIAGTVGNNTSFGTLVIATGGNGGTGGITTSTGGLATLVTSQTPSQYPLSMGNFQGRGGGTTGAPDCSITSFSLLLGNEGGGGTGANTSNVSGNGSVGSRSYDRTGTLSVGAAAGNTGGSGGNGTNNVSLQLHFDYVSGIPLNTIGFGTSGGGGGGSATLGTSGSGGTAGLYGSGGSGAGGCTNDGSIGTGGNASNGGQGCAIVFEYYV